jgi:magnesium-transporting ATPase (P-type)
LHRLPDARLAFYARVDEAGLVHAEVEALPPHALLDLGAASLLDSEVAVAAETAKFRGVLVARRRRFLVVLPCGGTQVLILPVPSELPVVQTVLPTEVQRRALVALFGDNVIPVAVPSRVALVAREISHPFFVFQLFAVGLWLCEDYAMYATTIFITSLVSCFLSASEARSNMLRLANLAQSNSNPESASHVPGDVIQIAAGSIVASDCTLVFGGALMDESSLTGEAAPVRKATWSPEMNHVRVWDAPAVSLFAGTRVITAHPNCRAIVTRTACSTCRGQLVRAILLKPGDVSSWGDGDGSGARDMYRVLAALLGIGVVGAVMVTLRLHTAFNLTLWQAVIESLDLITIAVPPALPATVTFGLACAMGRLAMARVLCVRASAVPRAAMTDVVLFDKVRMHRV